MPLFHPSPQWQTRCRNLLSLSFLLLLCHCSFHLGTCFVSCPQIRRFSLLGTLACYDATGTDTDGFDQALTTRLDLAEANAELKRLLQCNQTEKMVSVEGYITAKRAFGSSFTFLDISTEQLDQPVQAMLKRQDYADSKFFDGIFKAMVPGVGLRMTGRARPTRNPGEGVLLADTIVLTKWPRNPQHIRILLQLVRQGALRWQEPVFSSLQKEDLEVRIEAAENKLAVTRHHADSLQQVAKDIASTLEQDPNYPYDLIASGSGKNAQSTLPVASFELQNLTVIDTTYENTPYASENTLTVPDALAQMESATNVSGAQLQITGWVQNRRRFRNNITVLEIVDSYAANSIDEDSANSTGIWKQRLKCILHPGILLNEAGIYGRILAPGSQLSLRAFVDNRHFEKDMADGRSVLWIKEVCLLRATWRPATIQLILDHATASLIDITEAARALSISGTEMERLVDAEDQVERQWAAADISAQLQNEASCTTPINNEQLLILGKYEKLRKERYPVSTDTYKAPPALVSKERDGSRFQKKKLPQLQWVLQEVRQICLSHPDYSKRPLRILDVGGGRGLLANFLAESLPVEVQVVDIARKAVENGKMRSTRLDLSNSVKYKACDASAIDFSTGDFDIVVALHACGALTDIALSHAVGNKAAFVICPCCFQSNSRLLIRREIPIEDWLGVSQKDYSALKLLAEVQGNQPLASQSTHAICALRAAAVERHSLGSIRSTVKTFPIAFSTRNFALVGTLAK